MMYIKKIIIHIVDNYYLEFLKKNISSYQMYFLTDDIKEKVLDFPISKEKKAKLAELNFDSFLKTKNSEFEIRKKFLEEQFNIYSVEDIAKQLNPKNDIYFKVMNK